MSQLPHDDKRDEAKAAARELKRRELLEDCLILVTSLVLTEPRTTPNQQAMLPKLIRRLQKELS